MAFENESWTGILRRLSQVTPSSHLPQPPPRLYLIASWSQQMHLSGAYADCDVDWSVRLPVHRAVANMLVVRGPDAAQADQLQGLQDPSMCVGRLAGLRACVRACALS
jgi:hypothetical protein